jgi:hypothetical protein
MLYTTYVGFVDVANLCSYENTAEDAKNKWLSKSDGVYAFMSWAIESRF